MSFDKPDRLTATEIVIGDLAARGEAAEAIATELGLSVGAVEEHLARIYAKVGTGSLVVEPRDSGARSAT